MIAELEYQFQGVSQDGCPSGVATSGEVIEAGFGVSSVSESWREGCVGLRGDCVLDKRTGDSVDTAERNSVPADSACSMGGALSMEMEGSWVVSSG